MRIISSGKNEKEVVCSHCGATIGYCENEICEDNTGRFMDTKGKPLRFIICPQCRYPIKMD